ncbi:MAG: HIT family protein [Cellulomonadaceae bacterium]
MTSLFTKIIDGALPGRIVWSEIEVVAFTTIAPIAPGHTLIVPRVELSDFTQAPDRLLGQLIAAAKRIGAAQKAAWDAPRAAVMIAGFEIPHLHLHVLPAWNEAQLNFDNARTDVPAEELDADAERLREALRSAGYGEYVPD